MYIHSSDVLSWAALRSSWKGITTTCLEDKPFHVAKVKLNTVDFCLKNVHLDAETLWEIVSTVQKC